MKQLALPDICDNVPGRHALLRDLITDAQMYRAEHGHSDGEFVAWLRSAPPGAKLVLRPRPKTGPRAEN
jgi:hypothetical protein